MNVAKKNRVLTRIETRPKSDAMMFLENLNGGPLTFGQAMESIRLGEGESIERFASRLGVSRSQLCDIEKGRRLVSIRRAAEWAQILGQPESLFVELAVQSSILDAGLDLRVEVHSPARRAIKKRVSKRIQTARRTVGSRASG